MNVGNISDTKIIIEHDEDAAAGLGTRLTGAAAV
jgi:hypothetical protein